MFFLCLHCSMPLCLLPWRAYDWWTLVRTCFFNTVQSMWLKLVQFHCCCWKAGKPKHNENIQISGDRLFSSSTVLHAKIGKYVFKQHEKTWTDRLLQDGVIAGIGQPDSWVPLTSFAFSYIALKYFKIVSSILQKNYMALWWLWFKHL